MLKMLHEENAVAINYGVFEIEHLAGSFHLDSTRTRRFQQEAFHRANAQCNSCRMHYSDICIRAVRRNVHSAWMLLCLRCASRSKRWSENG